MSATASSSSDTLKRTVGGPSGAVAGCNVSKKTFADLLCRSGRSAFDDWIYDLEKSEAESRKDCYQKLVSGAQITAWLHCVGKLGKLPVDVSDTIRTYMGEFPPGILPSKISHARELQDISEAQKIRQCLVAADHLTRIARQAAESGDLECFLEAKDCDAVTTTEPGRKVWLVNVLTILKQRWEYRILNSRRQSFGEVVD
ncbi:unnamed protein product [Amoebophrya sp. A25]|nr:unnamed protein product [Amoebophrya sp. A25]|eukprot:GSA25T00022663001.1